MNPIIEEKLKQFVAENKHRLGAKKAKKIFLKMLRDQVAAEGAKRIIMKLWDLSTYNPECPEYCDKGIARGFVIVGKTKEGKDIRTQHVCSCVKQRRADQIEDTKA